MRRALVSLVCSVLAVTGGATVARAGAIAFASGTIDASDPTMPVVAISPPNCTTQLAFLVHYEARPFTVDVAGDYEFAMISDGGFASLYLMDAGFDPAAALPNCLAGDNGADPVGFTEPLAADTLYFAVPFDDTFAQAGGTWALLAAGPGGISLIIFVDGFESGDASLWSSVQTLD
jgi:hypothetical protein